MIARFLLMLCISGSVATAEITKTNKLDFAAKLFHNTFKVVGSSSGGTIWALGKRASTNTIQAVFITASHVLEGIAEDEARIIARRREGSNWLSVPLPLKIRDKSKPLWIKHPSVDVAAISVPKNFENYITHPVPEEMLATDATLQDLEITPGDDVFVPGYPFLIPTSGEFPVLRRGILASYPLTPMKEAAMYKIDCPIFRGNSGGVVFYKSRFIGTDDIRYGEFFCVLGIVVQATSVDEIANYGPITLPTRTNVGLANVIPAEYIRETLQQMR